MARSTSTSRSTSINDSLSIEHVVDTVRKLWKSIEDNSEEIERTKLKRDIAQTVNRLKGRVEKNLKSSKPSVQERLLFDRGEEGNGRVPVPVKEHPTKPRFPEAALRIYDKDLADHALSQIPAAIKFKTIGEFRDYLTEKLRFNSQATRRRAAGYLIGRYFPGDAMHRDLVEFAAKTAGKQALSDALFYLTCRMEPIVASVAEEVVFPSLPQGGVARSRVLGACPNICSCSRMAAGFRWALAFSASAQPCARTIPLNLPRRCRSGARSSKDCGSSRSVATRPTLSPGLATETCGSLART